MSKIKGLKHYSEEYKERILKRNVNKSVVKNMECQVGAEYVRK